MAEAAHDVYLNITTWKQIMVSTSTSVWRWVRLSFEIQSLVSGMTSIHLFIEVPTVDPGAPLIHSLTQHEEKSYSKMQNQPPPKLPL